MIVALLIAAVLYFVQRTMYGVMLTPDGHYYLAIGRGEDVPRPYSLRLLPKVIKSAKSWAYLQLGCYVGSVALASLCAERLGYSYLLQIASGLSLAVLPMMRRTITWTVLLDAPLVFVCLLTAYIALTCGVWVLVALACASFIHERGPLLAALYAAPFVSDTILWSMLVVVVCHALLYAMVYRNQEPHPDEASIDWLRNPLDAARRHHAPMLNDWRVWLLPWGGLLVGFAGLGLWGWITVAVCYAGCALSIDRVRIYQMAVFPVGLGLLAIAPVWALPLVVSTWFVNTKEI